MTWRKFSRVGATVRSSSDGSRITIISYWRDTTTHLLWAHAATDRPWQEGCSNAQFNRRGRPGGSRPAGRFQDARRSTQVRTSPAVTVARATTRSEERRVGKEGRCRGSPARARKSAERSRDVHEDDDT